MDKTYIVTIKDTERNRKVEFIADSFGVAGNRLSIKSKRFGNVVVELKAYEDLEVTIYNDEEENLF